MLKQRIITALILLPIALCGFFLLEGSGFALFIGLVVTLGAWEWARLAGFEAQLARVAFAAFVALLLFGLYVFPDLAPWVLGAAILWWGAATWLVLTFPESAERWSATLTKLAIGLLILLPAWQGLVLIKAMALGNWLIIDGQGRCMGGVVAGRGEQMKEVVGFLRTAGPTLSPFNAWIFLKGLETLSLRMKAHCANAQALAEWLEQQDGIEKVHYAGLKSHPQHELAQRQQRGFGAVVSFEVKGGKEGAWRFIDATRLISITANLGDSKTTITHPSTTSHGRLAPQEREAAGIRDSLIRIAVGLEDVADLQADLARGLAAL